MSESAEIVKRVERGFVAVRMDSPDQLRNLAANRLKSSFFWGMLSVFGIMSAVLAFGAGAMTWGFGYVMFSMFGTYMTDRRTEEFIDANLALHASVAKELEARHSDFGDVDKTIDELDKKIAELEAM